MLDACSRCSSAMVLNLACRSVLNSSFSLRKKLQPLVSPHRSIQGNIPSNTVLLPSHGNVHQLVWVLRVLAIVVVLELHGGEMGQRGSRARAFTTRKSRLVTLMTLFRRISAVNGGLALGACARVNGTIPSRGLIPWALMTSACAWGAQRAALVARGPRSDRRPHSACESAGRHAARGRQ